MKFSQFEKREMMKAWGAISLAFAILLRGEFGLLQAMIISAITVGAGFLLHEIAHKYAAQWYGHSAEFRSDDRMLVFAVLSAFLGFIFAAPGAVYIHGRVSIRQNGIIAAVGPLVNIVLGGLFFGAALLYPAYGKILFYGAMINAWLAMFNMIPFMGLDGAKVWGWNKLAFGAIMFLAFIEFMLIM